MPKILENLVSKVKATAKPGTNPYAVATAALQKQGKMEHGSQKLTPKGKAVKAKKGTSMVPGPIAAKTLGSMKKSLKFD